jgi:hypothetical protein
MPIAPVAEHPEKHRFWSPIQQPGENGSEITIHLRKPSVTNWGYDTVLFGGASVNPSLLSTGRPHELLEIIEAAIRSGIPNATVFTHLEPIEDPVSFEDRGLERRRR